MRFTKVALLLIVSFVVLFFSSEFILSRLSSSHNLDKNATHFLFLKSNGVHTDIVLKLDKELFDFESLFSFDDTLSKRDNFNFIAIGWGDKGFYLDTPTWAELKPSTALIATLGIGQSAFHITYYDSMSEDELTIKVPITTKQYLSIVESLKENLLLNNGRAINIKTSAQYGQNDAFYEAKGSYSMFFTCNTWTNNTLKKATLPSALWLVFDRGIFYEYAKVGIQPPKTKQMPH